MYIIASIISGFCAASIMTYISLATPLGPWIEPVLVLAALVIVRLIASRIPRSQTAQKEIVACVAASGGVAGIAAVACAFSYPTFFFLEPATFKAWLAAPISFICTLACIIIIAGFVAYALVELWEQNLLARDDLTFPVAQLVNKLIVSYDSMVKGLQLFFGSLTAALVTFLQIITNVIPPTITIFKGYSYFGFVIPALTFQADSAVMLVALGYVTGRAIIVSLMIGALAKIILLGPVNKLFFPSTNSDQMILAWCAGMVFYSALSGIVFKLISRRDLPISFKDTKASLPATKITLVAGLLLACAIAASTFFLCNVTFSLLSSIYLLLGSIICTYQLILIAGKIGLAPLGRFATFVMLPGVFLFQYTGLQATIVAIFVELCGGIAVELMFGRKLCQLSGISRKKIVIAQLLGLATGAITIGVVFWLLASLENLGTPPLLAQRACSRALLIHAHNFNIFILICGAAFGWLLHRCGINSVLAISGLLMPIDYILPLIVGGSIGSVVKNHEDYYPFWAGVFAASSLLMILKIVF